MFEKVTDAVVKIIIVVWLGHLVGRVDDIERRIMVAGTVSKSFGVQTLIDGGGWYDGCNWHYVQDGIHMVTAMNCVDPGDEE